MIRISSYALKSGFQRLLTPAMEKLVAWRVSPNRITLLTCLLCILYALTMVMPFFTHAMLLLMPLFLFLRMALNALDGMVATTTGMQTATGSVLNEVCDVISDAALLAAFVVILPGHRTLLLLLLFASLLIEFVSLAVYQAMRVRPFSGPFSKSDRAIFMACLALLAWLAPETSWLIPGLIGLGLVLSLITIRNRLGYLKKSTPG